MQGTASAPTLPNARHTRISKISSLPLTSSFLFRTLVSSEKFLKCGFLLQLRTDPSSDYDNAVKFFIPRNVKQKSGRLY